MSATPITRVIFDTFIYRPSSTTPCQTRTESPPPRTETPYYERLPAAYRPEFLEAYIPGQTAYLSDVERAQLAAAGAYPESLPPRTYARRILTRLLVDLAWASSRMEGNTYEILETERLIEAGQEASGKVPEPDT